MMDDPTYDRMLIDANPVWRLAWVLSELDNDNAPIGWGDYIRIANSIKTFRPDAVDPLIGDDDVNE